MAKHILVTTDFSKSALGAFANAKEVVDLYGKEKTKLTVLTIVEDVTGAQVPYVFGQAVIHASGLMEKAFETAKEELDKLCTAEFQGYQYDAKAIRTKKPAAQAIIEYAEENNVDLIVIARQGRSAIGRFFLGGTTEKVLHQAACPVLVVPEVEEDSE